MVKGDFGWAFTKMKEGHKVAKKSFIHDGDYWYMKNGQIFWASGNKQLSISEHCLYGLDWYIIPNTYIIYVCPDCNNQINKEVMGSKCPYCQNWTYKHLCEKEVTIKNE